MNSIQFAPPPWHPLAQLANLSDGVCFDEGPSEYVCFVASRAARSPLPRGGGGAVLAYSWSGSLHVEIRQPPTGWYHTVCRDRINLERETHYRWLMMMVQRRGDDGDDDDDDSVDGGGKY